MNTLDQLDSLRALDTLHMESSIGLLGQQLRHAWNDASSVQIPDTYKDVDHLVVFGMGGSALGTDVIQSLWSSSLRLPVTIVNDYNVPACVSERSLVLLSSYSGSTEEVLEAAQEVMQRTSRILVVTAGKDLEALARTHGFPLYKIDPVHNPCNQPRIAVGYSIIGQVALLASLGFITMNADHIETLASHVDALATQWNAERTSEQNLAKQLATFVADGIPILVSSEHLTGVAHVMRNQVNENGKHLCLMRPIPEMNHHALEGMGFPVAAKDLLRVVLFESPLYHKQNQTRYDVLEQLLQEQSIPSMRVSAPGTTKEEQAFGSILLGGYTAFYTGIIHAVDPSPIPWVDLFKEKLKA